MTTTHLTFAAALFAAGLTAAGAQASERAQDLVSAHYDARTQRICIQPRGNDVAELTGTRIYRRRCMTEQQWNARGVTFARVPRGERLAAR